MRTKIVTIDGVDLVSPETYDVPAVINDCCGAGEGWGQVVVPETIYGLRISPACHIHDYAWDVAQNNMSDFVQSNVMFLGNILAIIRKKSGNSFIRVLRSYRATTYYNAVHEVGKNHFFRLKDAQGRLNNS